MFEEIIFNKIYHKERLLNPSKSFLCPSDSSLLDLKESKWIKKLGQGSMHQMVVERIPSDLIIESKRLVTEKI